MSLSGLCIERREEGVGRFFMSDGRMEGRKEGKDSSSLILQTSKVTFSREILENAKSRVLWSGTGSRKLFIQSKPVRSMQSLMKRAVNKESVTHLAGF